MKQNLSIILILVLLSVAGCRGKSHQPDTTDSAQKEDTGKAVISFTEYEHNFGNVNEGEKVGCIFSFQNKGTASLIINSATTSCGCTVSKYSRKPIAPGYTGTLEVIFDTSGREGIQNKTITVRSNATIPVVLLKITAEVININ
jgi:hypothetical protein